MRGLDLIQNKRGWGGLVIFGLIALTGACAGGNSAGNASEDPFATGSVPSDGVVPGNDSTTPASEGAVPCDNNLTVQQAAQLVVTAVCPYADRCGGNEPPSQTTPDGPRESASELIGTFAAALAPGEGGEGGGGNGQGQGQGEGGDGSELGLDETCDVMRACARDGSACGGQALSDLDIPQGVCFGTLAYCAGLFFDALPCDLSSLGEDSSLERTLQDLPAACKDVLNTEGEPEPEVSTDPPDQQG